MQPSSSCPARLCQQFSKGAISHVVESDASDITVDGLFTQEHAYDHKPIALLRNILASGEKNYIVHNCELLAIVTCCKALAPNIDGQQIIVIADHKSLIHLHPLPLLNKSQIR